MVIILHIYTYKRVCTSRALRPLGVKMEKFPQRDGVSIFALHGTSRFCFQRLGCACARARACACVRVRVCAFARVRACARARARARVRVSTANNNRNVICQWSEARRPRGATLTPKQHELPVRQHLAYVLRRAQL